MEQEGRRGLCVCVDGGGGSGGGDEWERDDFPVVNGGRLVLKIIMKIFKNYTNYYTRDYTYKAGYQPILLYYEYNIWHN